MGNANHLVGRGSRRAFGAMTKDKLQMTEYRSHAMRKTSRGYFVICPLAFVIAPKARGPLTKSIELE
jgi:hypothetical protein